jgi:hypothetical protein
MADGAKSEYWPIVSNYCRACDYYLSYLIRDALLNSVPILDDTIVVKTVDLWIADYMHLFGDESVPAWFQEYSDEDKIIFIEHATNRKCEFGGTYQDIPCQWTIWQPYLGKDEVDSIKTVLRRIMIEYERMHGREMTELETLKAEFKIQFDIPDFGSGGNRNNRQIPFCERCTDDELITVLKHIMQMNPPKEIFFFFFSKEVARSLNLKKKRRMTAAEVIISEFEIRYNRQIVCRQCTTEELLMVWQHFGVRKWKYWDMRRDSIPNTVSDSLLRSLKKIRRSSPCCREDLDDYD